MYNKYGDKMRLRNITNAHDIVKNSKYVIEKYENNFNSNDIEIEIGMGKGDFIIGKALQNPNINYIGIEKYASVLVGALKKIENMDIPNLKIMNIDANTIDNYFNKNVSKIYLNFSDPWPKIRHSKRRLTSDVFLTKYKKIFKGDYFIEMKTDNQNLFEFSLVSLSQNNYKLDFVSLDLYSDLNKDNIATEYEKKFVAKNIKIYKLKAIQSVDKKKTK